LRHVEAWRDLVVRGQVLIVGPVRQEVLSGIRDLATFERLRIALRAFLDEELTEDDYEEAARCDNTCRAAGVAGSAVDHLLCGVALRRKVEVYTVDRVFSDTPNTFRSGFMRRLTSS